MNSELIYVKVSYVFTVDIKLSISAIYYKYFLFAPWNLGKPWAKRTKRNERTKRKPGNKSALGGRLIHRLLGALDSLYGHILYI